MGSLSKLNRQANPALIEKGLETFMFEVETEDLELLEKRVNELERYMGIEELDLDQFNKHAGEDLNVKVKLLEDFIR